MTHSSHPRSTPPRTIGHRLSALAERFLMGFSFYLVPLVIAIFSIWMLASGVSRYDGVPGQAVAFQVVSQSEAARTPAQALAELTAAPTVTFLDTHLAETPFWLLMPVPPTVGLEAAPVLEFPSRHAQRLECWNADTLARVGTADRNATVGLMSRAKAGFLLSVHSVPDLTRLLCRAEYSGPARIAVQHWTAAAMDQDVHHYHYSVGLLEGGLWTLVVFVLMAALINREPRYVLFAVWLVGNLRLGAISVGWDDTWLAQQVPAAWMPALRQLTIAAYYLVTYTLFGQFFKSDLARTGYSRLLRVGEWAGLVLLVLAIFLPFALFLPAMWAIVALGIGIVVFLLGRVILVARSRIAMWYAAALGIVLFSSFSEVIAAAFDFKALMGWLNSVTAALAASLVAAIAFAEQMRAERQERLRVQDELNRGYETAPVGLFTLSPEGLVLRANPAMQTMVGGETDLIGATWATFFEHDAWPMIQAAARTGDSGEVEVRASAQPGGAERWFLIKVSKVAGVIEGSMQDVTERVAAIEQLRFLAHNDSLTGVLNRRGIEITLHGAITEMRAGDALSLAYLDLDRFKLVNDLYGHHTGDEVLRQVCARIEQHLLPGQSLGRIGGDEFILVLTDTPLAPATDICRRIVDAIWERPFHLGTRSFQVKVSAGLIEVTSDMLARDAISAADSACRQAKQGVYGHLVVYQHDAPAFSERARALDLIKQLGSPFSTQDLYLVMQPIMSLRDPRASLNFEVLLRMRGPDGETIPPAKVVAAAEANGNIAELDKWVLTTTLQWISQHVAQLASTQFICVNLSGASLNDETFVEHLFDILERYRAVAPHLCIELTENVALHDLENSRRIIERLRVFGARIALDDFGAGYTSFSYLSELSADALKIDGSFVRTINRHPANLVIVEAIVELARNLGMRSIAEWVEDAATLEALAEIGVDYVQGFVVARPQSPDDILLAGSAADFAVDPQVRAFIDRQSDRPADVDDQADDGEPRYH